MSINRYNYQEYFLLYTDNELKVADRKAVEAFVRENPDLEQELVMLQDSILKPDRDLVFENKDALFQFNRPATIHEANFEEFAIAYCDNELDETGKKQFEAFIKNNPGFEQSLNLIRSLKYTAENSVKFPDKKLLYRYDKEIKPVVFPWWRMAAAATVLLFAGLLWLNKRPDSTVLPHIARATTPIPLNPGMPSILADKPVTIPDPRLITSTGTPKRPYLAENRSDYDVRKAPVKVLSQATSTGSKAGKDLAQGTKNNLPGMTTLPDGQKILTPGPGNPDESQPLPNTGLAQNSAGNDVQTRKQPVGQAVPPTTVTTTSFNTAVASIEDEGEENVYLSNIAIDKRTNLRGIIRKASRFLDKKTAIRNSKRTGIQIGNIEIAFQ